VARLVLVVVLLLLEVVLQHLNGTKYRQIMRKTTTIDGTHLAVLVVETLELLMEVLKATTK
jgi:hypothetical protein